MCTVSVEEVEDVERRKRNYQINNIFTPSYISIILYVRARMSARLTPNEHAYVYADQTRS